MPLALPVIRFYILGFNQMQIKKSILKKKKSRKFKKTNLKPATWQQHCIYKYLHNNTLVRKIPWMEEPGGPQSIGSRRVGHD